MPPDPVTRVEGAGFGGTLMAKNSRPSFQKRAKEKARQERRKEKDVRRAEARDRKVGAAPREGEDPDIAGIVPGPQPLPPEFDVPPTRQEP
jgi:hypothetical protein